MLKAPNSLHAYAEYMGWGYTMYTRRKWHYVKLIGPAHRTPTNWDKIVQLYYPAARLVRCTDTERVYNIGNTFDLLANGHPDLAQPAPIYADILRRTIPSIIASEIVGVQPMIGPTPCSLGSLKITKK